MDDIIIFVYGSLRHDCYNHDILGDSIYLGTSKLLGFKLYKVCRQYPAAIHTNNNNDVIVIETYKVSPTKLKDLDFLEGHPTYYKRIRTTCPDNNLDGLQPV